MSHAVFQIGLYSRLAKASHRFFIQFLAVSSCSVGQVRQQYPRLRPSMRKLLSIKSWSKAAQLIIPPNHHWLLQNNLPQLRQKIRAAPSAKKIACILKRRLVCVTIRQFNLEKSLKRTTDVSTISCCLTRTTSLFMVARVT